MKKKYVSLALFCASAALAQTPPVAQTPQPPTRGPSMDLALEAARVAVALCSEKGHKVGVSVVDSAGVLKVLLAADGASPRGVQSGNNKAVTALTFRMPTSRLGEQAKTNAELAAKLSADTNLNARAGGVLLMVGDDIVGAIGVGGARGSENDEACAVAGMEKIQDRLQ